MELKNIDGKVDLQTFLNFLEATVGSQRNTIVHFDAEPGKKYIRIIERSSYGDRSVYCFLDKEGNVYKSASWNAPAKHIRGNIISDPNFSYGKGLTVYGGAYLR